MEKEYFQFYDGEKMGMESIEDDVIIPAIYDFIEPFSDGLFLVRQNDAYAYFDAHGEVVIPFQNNYESYGSFSDGLARVRKDDECGYIDKTGKEIIKPQFSFAEDFSEGIAVVRNSEDQHGAIDKTGNLIIGYQFRYLSNFENGYAKFGDFSTFGIIDTTGEIVVPQNYSAIGSVHDKKVTIQLKENEIYKEGVLTIGGTVEWNNNLDEVNAFNHKYKSFTNLAETLIENMYREGCPCAYQRFRNFVQWDKPVRFRDQEVIFNLFMKHIEKKDERVYSCKVCGTRYQTHYAEYSILMQVQNVKITGIGKFTEMGKPVMKTIPVALGFLGYDLDKLKKKYKLTDNEIVISYLSEKADTKSKSNNLIQTAWQKLSRNFKR